MEETKVPLRKVNMIEHLRDIIRRFNGYHFVTISRVESYHEDAALRSIVLTTMQRNWALQAAKASGWTRVPGDGEFIRTFIDPKYEDRKALEFDPETKKVTKWDREAALIKTVPEKLNLGIIMVHKVMPIMTPENMYDHLEGSRIVTSLSLPDPDQFKPLVLDRIGQMMVGDIFAAAGKDVVTAAATAIKEIEQNEH